MEGGGYKEIYYKKLAWVIRKAGESQDLQSELLRPSPTRADGVVLVQRLAVLRPRQNWCFSLGLRAGEV